MSQSFLRSCFDKHHCDKGFKHQYEIFYAGAFEKIISRFGEIRMLEIGIFKAESTRAFVEYFEEMRYEYSLYGLDIFEREGQRSIQKLLNAENVPSYLVEDNSQFPKTMEFWRDKRLNFIIDDAEHTPIANTRTLENFWSVLDDGGIYAIEDVWPLDEMSQEEKKHHWLRKHQEDFTEDKFNKFLDAVLDRDKLTQTYDLRKPHPDSYIYELEKDRASVYHLSTTKSSVH